MPANRYTLRLIHRARMVKQVDTNIDPTSAAALREKLEDLVKDKTGTLNLDLSRWKLRVHRLGGGRIVATCIVDTTGRTVVRR